MRSFFQDLKKNGDGDIIKCKMHGIVHDFAQFLTKDECLVIEGQSAEEKRIRHIMLDFAEIPVSLYSKKNLLTLCVTGSNFVSTSLRLGFIVKSNVS
ncbi:hypothetical protein L484_000593 [Morus notabilis]|uniref:Uncharacterized protein n=1 Tax=Morus notabilis TaxID=981085 RepID=W9SDJ3_9ROSA|nr:hypothetical protein L484_000105 [Morus notabilis]EXC42625.1 hypothetical protein L484_000593 [Morus notabilis]